jgi:CRISPR/Cas system CMR subunit Cmr4 (Cas7 group RAMP superfamily)
VSSDFLQTDRNRQEGYQQNYADAKNEFTVARSNSTTIAQQAYSAGWQTGQKEALQKDLQATQKLKQDNVDLQREYENCLSNKRRLEKEMEQIQKNLIHVEDEAFARGLSQGINYG